MAVIAARVRYTFTSLLANEEVCVFPRMEIPEVCSNGATSVFESLTPHSSLFFWRQCGHFCLVASLWTS